MLITARTRKLVPAWEYGSLRVRRGCLNAFGNALGDSFVAYLQPPQTQPAGAVFNWDDADMDAGPHIAATGTLTNAQRAAMAAGYGPLNDGAALRKLGSESGSDDGSAVMTGAEILAAAGFSGSSQTQRQLRSLNVSPLLESMTAPTGQGYRDSVALQPVEKGVYAYKKWVDTDGYSQESWLDYPPDLALKDGAGNRIIPRETRIGGSSPLLDSMQEVDINGNMTGHTIPLEQTPARDPWGQALVRTSRAAWNNPGQTAIGVTKSLLNIGPSMVNLTINALKQSANVDMAFRNRAGMVPDAALNNFRNVQPVQLHTWEASNDAQRFGLNGTDALMAAAGGYSAWQQAGRGAALRGTNSAYDNALFNMETRQTQAASDDFVKAVAERRNLFVAKPGTDDFRFLEMTGADASAGGPGNLSILVKGENPQRLTLMEEFLHGTQSKRWGDPVMDVTGADTAFREWHVRDFMNRHSGMLGWDASEKAVLKTELDYWAVKAGKGGKQ